MTESGGAPNAPVDAIHRQVMWNRLVAVVEEQAQTILRTAFGSVVREAGDLSAGVYDLRGRMIAQAVTGTPGHVNTMARAVEHFLVRFPVAGMRPGDVFVTNDPWLGTGHLFDFVVVSPAFLDREPVALLASTCHLVDVGGRGFTADARSIHEEGVLFPHMKLRDRGTLNADLLAILGANSRNPVEARGDLLSLVSCNDTGAERLRDMMAEFDLASIEPLADHIVERSRGAMLEAMRPIPNGRYGTEMTLDGYGEPVRVKAEMTVSDEEIVIDYGGTSRASAFGINSPLCYTEAYTFFGLKCIVAPDVPNNHGSLGVFRTVAEPGSAVHPVHPSPVTARHVIGQMLADVAFGCLAEALPGRIPAESAGSIWVLPFAGAGSDTGGTDGSGDSGGACDPDVSDGSDGSGSAGDPDGSDSSDGSGGACDPDGSDSSDGSGGACDPDGSDSSDGSGGACDPDGSDSSDGSGSAGEPDGSGDSDGLGSSPGSPGSGGSGSAGGASGSRFNVMNVGMGGIGARPGKDGLSVTAFPSGVGAIPVEVTESESPLVFWCKEFLPDSGGAGAFRGGLGQIIEVGSTERHPFTVSAATFDRMRNPARGRDGGRPGRHGTARLASGARFDDKAVHTIPPGDRLVVELPGGGGLGDPRRRDPERIRADLEAGYITPEGAKRDYGVEAESPDPAGEGACIVRST